MSDWVFYLLTAVCFYAFLLFVIVVLELGIWAILLDEPAAKEKP